MSMLCDYRKSLNISQTQAANVLGVSLRTYQRYEKSSNLSDYKLNAIKVVLDHEFAITEEKGLLTISEIRKLVLPILDKYSIEMCVLFGSYAKNEATPESDVDLVMDIDNLVGLEFFKFVEKLRSILNKKVEDFLYEIDAQEWANIVNKTARKEKFPDNFLRISCLRKRRHSSN